MNILFTDLWFPIYPYYEEKRNLLPYYEDKKTLEYFIFYICAVCTNVVAIWFISLNPVEEA